MDKANGVCEEYLVRCRNTYIMSGKQKTYKISGQNNLNFTQQYATFIKRLKENILKMLPVIISEG